VVSRARYAVRGVLRAEGDDELIEAERRYALVPAPPDRNAPRFEIDPRHVAEFEPTRTQDRAQWRRDMARLDGPARHFRKHRREEHVIFAIDDRHVDLPAAREPREVTGHIHACEPRSQNDDACRHVNDTPLVRARAARSL